jgi:hypothetical protein
MAGAKLPAAEAISSDANDPVSFISCPPVDVGSKGQFETVTPAGHECAYTPPALSSLVTDRDGAQADTSFPEDSWRYGFAADRTVLQK